MVKPLQKLGFILAAGLGLGNFNASAQVNLSGSAYEQNFDGMGANGTELPSGWYALRLSGTGTHNEALNPIVTTGDYALGAIFNVGSAGSTDRALGTSSSNATVPVVGVMLTNTSGSTITRLDVTAVMEQWKSASSATENEKVIFEYSTDATSLITGAWTAVPELDLVEKLTSSTAASAVDGNDANNKTDIEGSITLQLENNETVWLRWQETNDGGSDGIYALDNLVITPTYASTTSVKDFSAGNIALYPNPTTGVAKLQLPASMATNGKVELTVYSLQGKVLLQASGTEHAINAKLSSKLNAAAPGVYIVRVDAGTDSYLTKIVKN